jgi:hypothetical protein
MTTVHNVLEVTATNVVHATLILGTSYQGLLVLILVWMDMVTPLLGRYVCTVISFVRYASKHPTTVPNALTQDNMKPSCWTITVLAKLIALLGTSKTTQLKFVTFVIWNV